MALQLDRNTQVASGEQMKKTTQQQDQEEVEMNDDDDAGAVVDTSRSQDGLLRTLLRLKVCLPSTSSLLSFVLRKKLVRSHLSRNQNYLGITHTEYDAGFVLTDEEHGVAHTTGGLSLRALDRRGVSYPMVLVRLRTGWGEFLRRSGVRQDDDTHVDDVVEIWAFRSPAWPTGLGLVLLHYTKEEDAITTASLLQQEEEEEEHGGHDDGGTSSDSDHGTSSDSSSGSDQSTSSDDSDHDDDDDERNCSPLDKEEEQEVVRAAAILVSMTK